MRQRYVCWHKATNIKSPVRKKKINSCLCSGANTFWRRNVRNDGGGKIIPLICIKIKTHHCWIATSDESQIILSHSSSGFVSLLLINWIDMIFLSASDSFHRGVTILCVTAALYSPTHSTPLQKTQEMVWDIFDALKDELVYLAWPIYV